MGKLLEHLEKQLSTEYKKDAEDCLEIYNKLKSITGHVWETEWRVFVSTIFKGFPSDERRYAPTKIGYVFLDGIRT